MTMISVGADGGPRPGFLTKKPRTVANCEDYHKSRWTLHITRVGFPIIIGRRKGYVSVLQMYSNDRRDDLVDTLHHQLELLCEELDRQLKPKLHGQMGGIISEYLPQTWVFETEKGACTVFIAADGNARVWSGAESMRDVTLRWRYEALAKLIKSRDRSSVEPGDYPDVLVQTAKGRAAFKYLKKEFGL